MENKSIVKKIGLIAVLVVIVVAIIFVIVNASSGKKEAKTGNVDVAPVSKSAGAENSVENNEVENTTNEDKKAVTKEVLEDGTVYSITGEEITPEIVVGDNYFDTQIADMNLNFNQYEGKTIEIEGLYFINNPYTFVGRYSLSNICPDCPAGYSYFEYEWNGEEIPELKDEETWIKLVGTLRKGNDGMEYYYIDVASLAVMNEKGLDTVSN